MHGRGHDGQAAKLIQSRVAVFGCGSVGAPVAVALAQAGVGHIDLVDNDKLEWANIGRHPLGARSVGKNKAEELASELQARFPHGSFQAMPTGALSVMATSATKLAQSDLIVSAMGSWMAESRLNEWHRRNGRQMPVLYGWTEAHAFAGHAVVVAQEGGCFRCGVDHVGVPQFQATAWPGDGSGSMEEPACGAHYQPYGPVELGFITSLVSQTALDCLLGKITRSTHRLYVARRSTLEEARGGWSEAFLASYPDRRDGGFVVDREWPVGACPEC